MIAEKPDSMKRIAYALAEDKNPQQKKNKGISYYEFQKNGKKHVIVSAVGHIFTLHHVEKGWKYPTYNYQWIPSFEANKNLKYIKRYHDTILEAVNDASEFIICCDYDTEGSVIGANILRLLCNTRDGKRMVFSTLAKTEINQSYKEASKHLDFNQIEAGLTRHELDWLYGINLSRALTLAMKRSAERGFKIISTGRVQGPTLNILMDKEIEIRNFISSPYWQIFANINVNEMPFVVEHEKNNFLDENLAKDTSKSCKKHDAIVKKINHKKNILYPPYPFNTTELQSEAYNKFRFLPSQTLAIAESLYQLGYISYPRSSSQKLPWNINYKKILNAINHIPKYTKFTKEILSKKKLIPNEGPKYDSAHPAIYPTHEIPPFYTLSSQMNRLYDLIVRRFLSVFAGISIREDTTVTLDIGGNPFLFKGQKILQEGWTKFYKPYVNIEDKLIPDLKIGEIIEVTKIRKTKKETKPPRRYSPGSIIKEMEKRGLGTRSTRSSILKTLYDRDYIKGYNLNVTKFGETLINVLQDHSPKFLDEELTRKMENRLESVLKETTKRDDIIKEARQFLDIVLDEFKTNETKIGKHLLSGFIESKQIAKKLGVCSICDGELKIIVSRKTKKRFCGCSNYPKCTNSFPLPQSGKITALNKKCTTCEYPTLQVYIKRRKPYRMCINHKCETKENWGKKKTNKKLNGK